MIFSGHIAAQEVPLFSLYQFNRYIYNPAYAGNSVDNMEIAYEGRRGFTGFSQGPFTNNLSVHTALRTLGMVVGGKITNHHISPYNYTSASITWGYQFQFPESQLTLALDAGAVIRVLDYGNLIKNDLVDATLDSKGYQYVTETTPDFGLGAYYRHDLGFYGGISISHLAPFKYGNLSESGSYNKLERYYFAMGGYTYHINDNFKLDPSFLIKFTEEVKYQYDISLVLSMFEKVGIGAIYRKNNTIVPIATFSLIKNIFLAYSYDQLTDNFGKYAGGSHEILVKYQLGLGPMPKKIEVDPRYY